jgi:hypothetical protein
MIRYLLVLLLLVPTRLAAEDIDGLAVWQELSNLRQENDEWREYSKKLEERIHQLLKKTNCA